MTILVDIRMFLQRDKNFLVEAEDQWMITDMKANA